MKHTLQNLCAVAAALLFALPAASQLSGTGYYRFRNATHSDYISIANDKFNYHTCISTAGGNLSGMMTSAGKTRALECAGKFLETDIHMIDDPDCIFPASVIYAKKNTGNQYNLIGQGTSLLTLTTGSYAGTLTIRFNQRYITIQSVSGSGANTLYIASIELKSANYSSYGNLGTRYFVENEDGKFVIDEGYSAEAAKWYIEPVTHFNVLPEVEYLGKYYTTIKVPFKFQLSGQVLNAYTIKGVNEDGTLEYEVVATTGGSVPAGTPVVLECGSADAADCQLIPLEAPVFTAPDESVTSGGAPTATDVTVPTEDNLLAGTYYCNTDGNMTFTKPSGTGSFNANHNTKSTDPQKYVIGITESGKLGFVPATSSFMPANKAWMETPGEFPWEPAVTHTPGDVNHDKVVDVDDVTCLILHILGNEYEGEFCPSCADVFTDDSINVDDVTAIISIILGTNNQ